MPKDAPNMVVELMQLGEDSFPIREYLAKNKERFDMLCHLLSSRGDPTFARAVKETMSIQWCNAFNIEYASLNSHDQLLIKFIMGGTIGLLASHGDGESIDFDNLSSILQEIVSPHLKKFLN
jgi:hypothetical protein